MRLFEPAHLQAVTTRTFEAAGWNGEDAGEVARHFVRANLAGHDSHGIGMLPLYLRAVDDGWLKPANQPLVKRHDPPFLVIDACVALGQPTARRAVSQALDIAKGAGIAVLNLIDAHHVGRIGDYAEQVAAEGLVSLFWVNVAGRPPIVAPHGAREARWGTNPHAVGVPMGADPPLILDFATSRMAHGKVRVALNKGEPVPPGHLIDAAGEPTDDPSVAFPPAPMGALLPFGEHKGAGLSLMVEILAAGLGGGAMIERAPHRSWILNSLFAILIDPSRLDPDDAARSARLAAIAAWVRSAAPQNAKYPVMAPGDMERALRTRRAREGIPLDDETWRQIVAATAAFGIDAERRA
jgi:hydroxycarboxylate dehydrogenase B